jgi:hypothetical protein
MGIPAKREEKQVTGGPVSRKRKVERIWGGGPGFFQPTGKPVIFYVSFRILNFEFGIAVSRGRTVPLRRGSCLSVIRTGAMITTNMPVVNIFWSYG